MILLHLLQVFSCEYMCIWERFLLFYIFPAINALRARDAPNCSKWKKIMMTHLFVGIASENTNTWKELDKNWQLEIVSRWELNFLWFSAEDIWKIIYLYDNWGETFQVSGWVCFGLKNGKKWRKLNDLFVFEWNIYWKFVKLLFLEI